MERELNLLAFDTSTERMSVALVHSGRLWRHNGPGAAQASAQLIPVIQRLMTEAGLTWTELQAIAFGRGPGSFTGLRTACSVAQGLAFGADLPVLAIDTLLALAEDARERHGCAHVVAALDARMEQIYQARYEYAAGCWSQRQAPSLVNPEQIVVPADAVLAGNAWAVYGERLPAGIRHVEAWPEAAAMLRLAPAMLAAGQAVPAEQALPLYVRDKVAQTTAERAKHPKQ